MLTFYTNIRNEEEEFKIKKFESFVFFDFESYLNEKNEHVVNLAMAQKVFKECLDIPYQNRCIMFTH